MCLMHQHPNITSGIICSLTLTGTYWIYLKLYHLLVMKAEEKKKHIEARIQIMQPHCDCGSCRPKAHLIDATEKKKTAKTSA